MKLRIKGNSLRLRVSRSEVERFLRGERIEEAIHFSADPSKKLTYVLESAVDSTETCVNFEDSRIGVSVSKEDLHRFAKGDQVGIYTNLDIGSEGNFELVIEKDFTCLDRTDKDNVDTFPNPHPTAHHGATR
jgi:hypothetical protein